ncbi:MAG: ATP-dependent DNA helicase [Sutterella sp.]|nr:ATP-dependent DNA helicase [Sutterella sp.]
MSRTPEQSVLLDVQTPLVKRVSAAFSSDGALSKSVKGYRPREGQTAFSLEVAKTIESNGTLIAEAGTGTGKTFAYLTPALLAGVSCVISTAGKPLQDQLFKKDLPALQKALGTPVRVSLLKGRANYVCLYRLELARSGGMLPEQNSYVKLRLIERFAQTSRTGDRSELGSVPEDDRLWPMVTSTRENCLGKERCPKYDECFVKKAREAALESQVVVVNHHLYLSSMALRQQSDAIDGMLPKAALTVIDEAHQLPGIASDFFGTSFSTYEVEDVSNEARTLGRLKAPDGAAWDQLYDASVKAVRELRLAVQGIGLREGDRKAVWDVPRFGELSPGLGRLIQTFADLGEALRANKGRDNDIDTLAERHAQVLDEMKLWEPILKQFRDGMPEGGKIKTGDRVRWIEVTQFAVRFNNTPLSFSEEFRKLREAEGGSWVFTSATLSSDGDFSHFKSELGIDGDCRSLTWGSPFKYWEQGCFYLPRIPAPANNTIEHTRRVVEATWPLIRAAGGRTFLLCTSLAAVEEASRCLAAKLEANGYPFPLLVQGSRPKMALIDEFRLAGNAVLVGSMSFWEGVDVKGDALSLVIIDKIPFAPPNDPVGAARCEAIREKGGNPFFMMTLPEAVISLKQGAGRLIRSEEDRGMLVLCDARVVEKGYGQTVIRSLPDFFKTRREDKALQFFLSPAQFAEGLYRR